MCKKIMLFMMMFCFLCNLYVYSYSSVTAGQGETDKEELNDIINNDEISENTDKAIIENSQIQNSTSTVKKEFSRLDAKEADLLFKKALSSYENGNISKSKELFEQAMQELLNANISAETYCSFKDEFNSIFSKLDKLNTKKESKKHGKYVIQMDAENDMVKKYIKLYCEGKARPVIQKAFERSGRYREMILKILKEYDLPEELVYLPVVESLYNINDLSRAGALGLWQLMPDTARGLGLKVNYWIDERKDPEKSTRAAAKYLKELYLIFDNWHLVLAAYNRGEFGFMKDLYYSKATNIEEMKNRKAVPKETELYVPQFIASTLIGDNYKEYGFNLNFDLPIKYDTVKIDKIVDLKIAADCAGTSLDTLKDLNPAIKAWCTPHNYPCFELRVPAGTKDIFIKKICLVKELNPFSGYIKYKIKKGDYLEKIAKKFDTSVKKLKEDNRIKNSKNIRIGQMLVIRPGKKYMLAEKTKS